MSEEIIKYIIECILDNYNNVINLPRNEFNDAKRLAYYEILNTIKSQLEINDIDLEKYGLAFDIEDIL